MLCRPVLFGPAYIQPSPSSRRAQNTCPPRLHGAARRRARKVGSIAVRAGSSEIATWIEENGATGAVTKQQSTGGSDWSSTYTFTTERGKFFVKTSNRESGMFDSEAAGLRAMHATRAVRIPQVFHSGPMQSGGSFIVMEYLELSGGVNQVELGRRLAQMHKAEPLLPEAKQGMYGFSVNNTIGGTPQPNEWGASWPEFFRDKRLLFQCKLAGDARVQQLGDRIAQRIDSYFEGATLRPAILHGDLWSGNIAQAGGEPCIFDPATYYGHAEAEFGMSWCASFGDSFWKAYHEVLPREPGFEKRQKLYKLYHILNHYNMFGGGYYSNAVGLMEELVR